MAELHIQPRKSQPWWLWILALLALVAVAVYFSGNDAGADGAGQQNDTSEIR